MALQISQSMTCLRIITSLKLCKKIRLPFLTNNFSTAIDAIDSFTCELLQKHRYNKISQLENVFRMRYYMETDNNKELSKTPEDLDTRLQNLLSKNKDKQLENLVLECIEKQTFINVLTLKKLFRHYSAAGKPDIVATLQKYSSKIDQYLYRRNGEFQHYLAKAQCMKGNTDKGLALLLQSYEKYEGLRSLYRLIFKELINDSVLNRSEATLVIFKRYVLEFSDKWQEHYPLVCFWYMSWSSTWFSDQVRGNELLESSAELRDVIKDRATAFSITVLRDEYNEDAVMRLLQILLKYDMMSEYAKVLQILFGYKVKNRDLRGCTEIMRNCDALGITLPSYQQGRYIKMLISGRNQTEKPKKPTESKIFKLKF